VPSGQLCGCLDQGGSRPVPQLARAIALPREQSWSRRGVMRHWPGVRAHARQAARRSSPVQTAPATAGSRNARTGKARHPGLPGLPGTLRRPRARTDHMSHSSPATCRSAAGPGPRSHTMVIAHHVGSAPAAIAAIGYRSGHHPRVPLTDTERSLPGQIQARPRRAAAIEDSARRPAGPGGRAGLYRARAGC
jgi:hypothetical protein